MVIEIEILRDIKMAVNKKSLTSKSASTSKTTKSAAPTAAPIEASKMVPAVRMFAKKASAKKTAFRTLSM
jgi:hypothetical protein